MLIYTFRFEKLKNEIITAPQLVELPQCTFLKLLKFLISNFLNLTPAAAVWISEIYFLVFQVFFFSPSSWGPVPQTPLVMLSLING